MAFPIRKLGHLECVQSCRWNRRQLKVACGAKADLDARVFASGGGLTDSRVLPGAKKPCGGQPREGAPVGHQQSLRMGAWPRYGIAAELLLLAIWAGRGLPKGKAYG